MEKPVEVIRTKCPADLKMAFENACKQEDLSASQVLRKLMRQYVKEHAQPELPLVKGKK